MVNLGIKFGMAWVILILFLAFALIIKGGDLMVESSIFFAKRARIPSIVVGATIVAIATTFPEMSVALMSGIMGSESLAVNTSIGSMVCNFALVLGLAFTLIPSPVSKQGLDSKVVYFIIGLLVLTIVGLDQNLSVIDAIILLIVFIVVFILNFLEARKMPSTPISLDGVPKWHSIISQFLVGAFSIGYGANILVQNVETLETALNMSEGLVGVLVIAVGTNIPELVTSISAVRLKDSEIGIGNIFGASFIDATLLIATTVLTGGGGVVLPIKQLLLTLVTLIIITAVIVVPIIKSEKSNRLQGIILLVLFIVYSLILAKIS